jgi:hypothetical protein
MNTRKCAIAIGLVAAFLSNSIVSAKETNENHINYMVGGGECFAKHATNELINAENDWCPVYKTDNSTVDLFSVKKTNKQNPVVVIISDNTVPPVIIDDGGETIPEDNDNGNEEKECKNKNSGKDGTPSECNAGKGQEKNN